MFILNNLSIKNKLNYKKGTENTINEQEKPTYSKGKSSVDLANKYKDTALKNVKSITEWLKKELISIMNDETSDISLKLQ